MTTRTENAKRRHHIERALAWRAAARDAGDDRREGVAAYWNALHRALADHARDGDTRSYRAAVRRAFAHSTTEPDPANLD